MWTTIVTVLATVLTIFLGIAGYTTLGHRMENVSARSELAQYTDQFSQIQGALTLYQSDHNGTLPSGMSQNEAQDLIDGGYLNTFPSGPWLLEAGNIYRVLDTNTTCRSLNDAAGLDVSSRSIAAYGG